MARKKQILMVAVGLAAVAGLALLGGVLKKRPGREISQESAKNTVLRCAYDGTKIQSLYQVDAYLAGGSISRFCSIYCAAQWFKKNKDRVIYLTVVDEMTGQRFDSTLGHYVESDVVTVREVRNRIHAFAVKEDALKHAEQFNGKLVKNPFGAAFVLPKVARFDKLKIGAPALPDSIPLKLAIFRPIFKENRLNVEVVTFKNEADGKRLLAEGSVEGVICDLPVGLALAKGEPSARIVKNVLRANPYRPLFAIVAGKAMAGRDLSGMEGKAIAVPKGLSFRFYTEFFLKKADMSPDQVMIREVNDPARAWDLLCKGEVKAAVLRTPYTDLAAKKRMTFLADDRNLPWMSVMVFKQSTIAKKTEAIKRFVFGLEQSVLALNLKPDEFRTILQEQGGIPKASQKKFPMPIFEGANAPSPDELEILIQWLDKRGILKKETPYGELVDPKFLPNPDDVGLAFCCR